MRTNIDMDNNKHNTRTNMLMSSKKPGEWYYLEHIFFCEVFLSFSENVTMVNGITKLLSTVHLVMSSRKASIVISSAGGPSGMRVSTLVLGYWKTDDTTWDVESLVVKIVGETW